MLDAVLGSCVGIDHSLDERVACQTVAAVQTRARTFAQSIQAVDARTAVEVDLDAAAHIVGCRTYGNVVFGDVDADAQALGIDVGEVVLGLFGILVSDVEAYVVESVLLHLLVDGTCHDVAWSQTQSLVVFLHEALAVGQAQDAAIATHGFGDEEGRMSLAWVEEGCGVELYELHVGHCSLGTIDHSLAVARGDHGVGSGLIDSSAAACAHHCHLAQIGVHLLGLGVEHIGSVAVDVRSATCDACA